MMIINLKAIVSSQTHHLLQAYPAVTGYGATLGATVACHGELSLSCLYQGSFMFTKKNKPWD